MNAEYNKSGLRNLENHKLLSNSVKIILFYVTLEEKFLLEWNRLHETENISIIL